MSTSTITRISSWTGVLLNDSIIQIDASEQVVTDAIGLGVLKQVRGTIRGEFDWQDVTLVKIPLLVSCQSSIPSIIVTEENGTVPPRPSRNRIPHRSIPWIIPSHSRGIETTRQLSEKVWKHSNTTFKSSKVEMRLIDEEDYRGKLWEKKRKDEKVSKVTDPRRWISLDESGIGKKTNPLVRVSKTLTRGKVETRREIERSKWGCLWDNFKENILGL